MKNPVEIYNSLDFKNFNIDMLKFVNENNIKSDTGYLITTSLKTKYTYIFKEDGGKWEQIYKWRCTVGKKTTPTIKGYFYITGRKPYFGTTQYRAKYATRFIGRYYYHSILYDSTGKYVIDSRLGMEISHGCIRLLTQNAKWIYDNIPNSTPVIIA